MGDDLAGYGTGVINDNFVREAFLPEVATSIKYMAQQSPKLRRGV